MSQNFWLLLDKEIMQEEVNLVEVEVLEVEDPMVVVQEVQNCVLIVDRPTTLLTHVGRNMDIHLIYNICKMAMEQ
jgi:hypothetical protein